MDEIGVEWVDELAAVATIRARAEAVEWSAMLAFDEALRAEYSATESYFVRQAEMASIALSIAAAMYLSEAQVHRKLGAARILVEQAPTVWSAFADGVIDANRATMIAHTVDKLRRPESVTRLDTKVITYARSHTSIQLKTWLKKYVTDTESDLFNERAETEREQRRVEVEHGDDAMSWLMAYLPSHVAAAIDKRLTRDAKAMVDDPRTLAQRKADLFASYLTCNEAGELVIGADIAVLIDADTLVGQSDTPATAADGSFVVPAQWVLDAATHPFWHTIITNPQTGNVLEHHYKGRFAPEILAKAIRFRDGTCQAPTCTKPAQHCDNDHRIPWPNGPTTGNNMWALCPRHHRMKTHDVITWSLPTGQHVDTWTPADDTGTLYEFAAFEYQAA